MTILVKSDIHHVFVQGEIRKTVQWYLTHQDWVSNVQSGSCRQWLDKHYGIQISL